MLGRNVGAHPVCEPARAAWEPWRQRFGLQVCARASDGRVLAATCKRQSAWQGQFLMQSIC